MSQRPRVRYPVRPHTFVSPSADSRRAVVSYWRKYVHEVLANRLGGLSLPRKSVVRLTDRPDMITDVYCGRKTTLQQRQWRRHLVLCELMRQRRGFFNCTCYIISNLCLFDYTWSIMFVLLSLCRSFSFSACNRCVCVCMWENV